MPTPSRWLIRLSLIYLVLGITMGSLMLIQKAYPVYPAVWMLLPVHIEVTIFGWIIQLTLGTAYWMLPRFLNGKPRGDSALAYVMIALLNLGIIFVITDNLLAVTFPFRLAGRILEAGAVIVFVSLHWNRIVTYRKTSAV